MRSTVFRLHERWKRMASRLSWWGDVAQVWLIEIRQWAGNRPTLASAQTLLISTMVEIEARQHRHIELLEVREAQADCQALRSVLPNWPPHTVS
jgi:hypothetical protein